MTLRDVKLYPYQIKLDASLDQDTLDKDKLKQKFDRAKIKENLVSWDPNHLALIIDNANDSFIDGRFIKLRDDHPTILNKEDGTEREIDILDEENIIETSHFIFNTNDNILLGEYNFHAIRFFSTPLKVYLCKTLTIAEDKIDVIPIENKDTYRNMKDDTDYVAIYVKVGSYSLSTAEKEKGVPILKSINDIMTCGDFNVGLKLSRRRKKGNFLKKEKIWQWAEDNKGNEDISSLKVETENTVYDLLKNNLVYYSIKVDYHSGKLDKDNFFTKAKGLYSEKVNTLKRELR